MANQQKTKGTSFESGCVNYLRANALIDVARVPLHGRADNGDLEMTVHGHRITAECKCVERVSDALLAKFRLQATVESQNAGTDGAVLLQWRQGCGYRWAESANGYRAKSFGGNLAHMTVETLLMVVGATGEIQMHELAAQTWVTIPVAEFALLARDWGSDGN